MDNSGVATMARPRKQRATGATPPAREPRPVILSIRGTIEWREWLGRLADHNRVKTADAIDHAIVAWAKAKGFKEPPPQR